MTFIDGIGTALVYYNKILYIKGRCYSFLKPNPQWNEIQETTSVHVWTILVYRTDLQKWGFGVSQFGTQFSVPETCK